MIAARLKVESEQITSWEKSKSYPQFDKAQELAKILRIPFGYLFLSKPPKRRPPTPGPANSRHAVRPDSGFQATLE